MKKGTATTKRRATPRNQGVVSRAVEAVSNIFTGDEGRTNAIDLLKADHDNVEELFSTIKNNEDADHSAIFQQIRSELEVHTHIEEQFFYPHLLNVGNDELQSLTREALEEHRQVKTILEDLESLSSDRPAFDAKLKVLIEDVEHHVEEEESEMFPLVEDELDEETLLRLGNLMQAEKQRFAGTAARTATAR